MKRTPTKIRMRRKKRKPDDPDKEDQYDGFLFATHPFELAVTNQLIDYAKKHAPEMPETDTRVMAAERYQRLKSMKDAF